MNSQEVDQVGTSSGPMPGPERPLLQSEGADDLTFASSYSRLHAREFHRLRTIPIVVVQICICVLLVVLVFAIPGICAHDKCHLSSFSIAAYIHIIVWCLLWIADHRMYKEHERHRNHGYLELHRMTNALHKAPKYIFSAGNALLVILMSIWRDYCLDSPTCPFKHSLSDADYVAIVATLEVAFTFPFYAIYLHRVINFNAAEHLPDVFQEDRLLASYMNSQSSVQMLHREEIDAEDLLERQADVITYLQDHNRHLNRRLADLTAQLQTILFVPSGLNTSHAEVSPTQGKRICMSSGEGSSRMTTLKHVEFEVHGQVQGVFFRKYTQNKAKSLSLVGFCRNTIRGTVEGAVEGESDQIDSMKDWLYTGSPHSRVSKVDFRNEKTISSLSYSGFSVRH
ncbi:unnamed protein product [Darwinula stevensoni]|uniref:acylphosphatase n=1 Tax=Darwinula stevensoni TaxID=69355 RepID=A0A7R9A372_9CRUS|nr:unnamed protein product [Darwinula stevensoni]CAG0890136.1 unnamed protein product [Darwinula stevensoni]